MPLIPSEIAIAGVYFPPLLFAAILGIAGAVLTAFLLNRFRLSRFFYYPPVVFLALAEMSQQTEPVAYWLRFATLQVVLGPLVGIAVGFLGGKLVYLGSRTKWMNHSFQQLSALAISFLAFFLAEAGSRDSAAARRATPALSEVERPKTRLAPIISAVGMIKDQGASPRGASGGGSRK